MDKRPQCRSNHRETREGFKHFCTPPTSSYGAEVAEVLDGSPIFERFQPFLAFLSVRNLWLISRKYLRNFQLFAYCVRVFTAKARAVHGHEY